MAVAFCNRVGNEEGLTFWGGSRLIGADGVVLAQAPPYQETLLIASFDPPTVAMARRQWPLLAEERLTLTRRELDRIIALRAGLTIRAADAGAGLDVGRAHDVTDGGRRRTDLADGS